VGGDQTTHGEVPAILLTLLSRAAKRGKRSDCRREKTSTLRRRKSCPRRYKRVAPRYLQCRPSFDRSAPWRGETSV